MKNHTTSKGRPLSFPSAFESLPSIGPASPQETSCCRCRRAKSVTAIFPPSRGRQTSPKRTGRGVFPKLSWSVFKSKHAERSLRASSSQNLYKDSKPTSWTFYQWSGSMAEGAPSTTVGGIDRNGDFALAAKQAFVMTPVNARSTSSRSGSSNSLSTNCQSSSAERKTDSGCLRKYVLNRDIGTQTPPGSFKRKNVPRSPGPLDGSLYTQVKKSRRVGTDESDDSNERVKLYRDYHSADELSAAATLPLQPGMERKSFSGSNIKGIEMKDKATPNQDTTDGPATDPSMPLLPSATSPAYDGVDLLRDVTVTSLTVTAEVVQGQEEGSDDLQPAQSAVDDVTLDEREEILQDVQRLAVVNDTTTEVEPQTEPQPVELLHVNAEAAQQTPTEGEQTAPAAVVATAENDKQPEDLRVAQEAQKNIEIREEEQEEDMENLQPSPENHLTQTDVDNVMALVNECLEDTAAHAIVQPDAFGPIKHGPGFTDMGPTFSPQQPDYPALEVEARFEEKGPEYALPVRDVVLTSIPARKAVLVTAPDTQLADVNNSNNAALLESGGYSTIDDLQTEAPQRAGHKNSLDSGHSVGSAVTTSLHIAMSNSDVDSGIDGSATVISTSSDVRPSPTLDRSTVTATRVTSSLSDAPHHEVRMREVPREVERRSECVGTEQDFAEAGSETSSTQFPEPAVEYIPAPREADIKIITIKNVYAGGSSQNTTAEIVRSETPKSVEPLPVPPSALQAPPTAEQDEEEKALEEEERRMQEEIENTRKKLLWLEEQRSKMKKKKQEAAKRHSFTTATPVVVEAAPKHVISSTLPRRPPTHVTPVFAQSQPSKEFGTGSMSAKERQDIDELLRSVEELDFTIPQLAQAKPKAQSPEMATTAMPPEHHPHFHETSPGFKVPDASVAQRAVVFTPAYAHPMHQPQHIPTQQQQMKIQEERQREELRRRRLAEEKDILRRQMEQEALLVQRRERDFLKQEEKRKLEREEQEKFQVEFENKQKLLRQESGLPPKEIPLADQLQQQKKRLTSSRSSPLSSVTSPRSPPPGAVTSPPLPQQPQETRPVAQDAKPDVGPDLQSQLDELDRYIAQLSSVADIPVEAAASPSKSEVIRRRRSFSVELERRMDPSLKLTSEEMSSPISSALVPPRPPSRTRSSYDSVSRRLSHGFELAQVMRQTSVEKEPRAIAAKDDDVFDAPQSAPQPSYPPKTSLTRPAQQQIIARPVATPPAPAPASPADAQSKSPAMEDRLSPQLFLAMSINPGGRPVENVHSYKEDLAPEALPGNDVIDGLPATPGFPNVPATPATPYVNDSPAPGHVPVGLTKTPLAALGLKPKDHPQPAIDEIPTTSDQNQVRAQLNGAPKQQDVSPVTSSHGFANGYVKATATSTPVTSPLATTQNYRLEEQARQRENAAIISRAQDGGHVAMATAVTDGYPEHFKQVPQNGWAHQAALNAQLHAHDHAQPSHWVQNGENPSPLATTPTTRSPVVSSLGHSLTPPALGSGGVSPAGTRSLTGSNDSLLSDGSASGKHPHPAYQQQQQRFGLSNPPLPPKESSRHSGSSVRSTSTAGSGYLGGTSQTSPHSAGSPVSTSSPPYLFGHAGKRESQLSAYDRQVPHGHALSSDDGGLSSPASVRTSSSSISDMEKLAHDMAHAGLNGSSPPKFIKDTTSYWYKKDITREQALLMLRDMPAGSFVVRDSRCYPGAFGLALKVHEVPQAVIAAAKPGTDMNDELVRHFLIEPSSRGVKLKGCANEPVFGSLSALIYQHSITPLALPCKLIIPSENMEVKSRPGSVRSSQEISNSAAELLRQGAACNVLYLGSADTESLTGPEAIERAMREVTQNLGQAVKTSVVHFKVSAQGITLTDNARKIFFRRHYPTATLTHCGIDPSAREPHNRRWDATAHRGPSNARVFGFVAKKTGTAENSCHLFAELDMDQPAPAIVNFINKILLSGSSHS